MSLNSLMFRDPLTMIRCWNDRLEVHQEPCSHETLGMADLVALYNRIRRETGTPPLVVDTDLLQAQPEAVLNELCFRLNIPFYPEMLQWKSGPKPGVDGIWASHWYHSVHKTTGFQTQNKNNVACKRNPVTEEMLELFTEVVPFYDFLRQKAIGRKDVLGRVLSFPKNETLPSDTSSTNNDNTVIIDHGRVISISANSSNNDAGVPTSSNSLSDPRNANVLIFVHDQLRPRHLAAVSVFDSTVQGGDAVWEGMRVYDGKVFKMEEHLDRLFDSARSMAFKGVPSREFVKDAIFATLEANNMRSDAHLRLTLSRGLKVTSSMNPMFNVFGCTLLVVAEWKPVGNAATYDNNAGIKLITAANRRNGPATVDSKIHHCNLINNILPKIQANQAGAADALMLDAEGYVSETNATNVFMVKKGIVSTPLPDYCLPGITRNTIISVVKEMQNLPDLQERRISLAEFHSADEVFTTGTMGELTPVIEIDGRPIGDGRHGPGPITLQIQARYRELTATQGVPMPWCQP